MAAAGLSGVLLFVFCACVVPTASGDRGCKSFTDAFGFHEKISCDRGFCCGSCVNRYCCKDTFWRFDEDKQEDCGDSFGDMQETVTIASGVAAVVILIILFICCCVCPCCCLYKMCRKPRPVIATTTHTTVVTSNPQGVHYPQQPTVHAPPQSYQGGQYPGYQPIPAQPGYGAQPQVGYGAPNAPYQGALGYTPGPPPPYQEAAPGYSAAPPMPYSQAAYAPGQPAYPLQPPSPAQPQAQPNAPPAQPDYLSQPAYNPAYAPPPPKS